MGIKSWWRRTSALLLAMIVTCGAGIPCYATEKNTSNTPRVLFLSSYDYDWDSVPKQLEGFASVIDSHAKSDYVFMDTKTNDYDEIKTHIYEQIESEYEKGMHYDVVVLGDDAALDFALEYQTELFQGTPLVFEGINTEEKANQAGKDPLITGVVESFPMEDTISLAYSLYPNAKQIVAIADDSESCKGSLKQYYDSQYDFSNLSFDEVNCSKMTEEQIKEKLGTYGKDTILLFLLMSENAEGHNYTQYEAAQLVTSSAHIPVFKTDELGIGDGFLGGVVISYESMGRLAGQMAMDIINGTSTEQIKVQTIPYHAMFDENVMKQYGIKSAQLPEDTNIINHVPTFWENYHRILIPIGGVGICIFILMILFISWNHRKKKYFEELHEKDLILDNLVKNVPGGVAIYKIGKEIENTYFSDGIPALSGRTVDEYKEWVKGDLLSNTIYEEDLQNARQLIMDAVEAHAPLDVTYRLKHKNGSNVWVQISAIPIRKEANCSVYYAVYTTLSQETILYRNITTDSPTGLYICDADNYSMLYSNKSMAEALGGDGDYAGKKCYEYLLHLDEPCSWCPMNRMTEEEYFIRDFHVPHKNRHLIMRGKLINWNGVKAHIEYVVDNTRLYNEQKEKELDYQTQMNLLSRISDSCIANFQMNITNNCIADGFGENLLTSIGVYKADSLDGWVNSAQQFVPDSKELEQYIQMFNRNHLLEAFHNGQNRISMEHHMLLNHKTIHWCRSTVVMTQNPGTGDVEGYIYAEDINDDILRKALLEKSLQTRNEFFLCVDEVNDTHILFDSRDISKPLYSEKSEHTIREYVTQYYADQDMDAFMEKCSIQTAVKKLQENDSYSFYFPIILNGDKKYFQATYSYLNQDTNMIAILLMDITEIYNQHKTQAQKLQKALQEAEAANRAKTEFLSRMSHDMRTPMNGILGLSYLMEHQTDIADVKKEIPQLRESGQYLLQLINDVLDVNKVESGKIELHPKECDEKQLFDSIIELMQQQMEEKAITFVFEKENVDWATVMLDSQRVKQIFVNLLGNAVKFTSVGGKVEFHMKQIGASEQTKKYQFIVRDNGIGMSQEFLPDVFKPFAQENRLVEQLGGTGLGLSIVKSLVELMGGDITVQSELNQGSKFELHLEFPIVMQPKDFVKVQQASETMYFPENLHVLLCEDHPLNAKIAMRLLQQKGAEVTWKENGQLGVETFVEAEPNTFDVILMDIRMPVMDGIEATKAIRASEKADAKTIPIIAMTANAYEEDVKKSMEAGINEHLAKPVEPVKMYETIAKHIGHKA